MISGASRVGRAPHRHRDSDEPEGPHVEVEGGAPFLLGAEARHHARGADDLRLGEAEEPLDEREGKVLEVDDDVHDHIVLSELHEVGLVVRHKDERPDEGQVGGQDDRHDLAPDRHPEQRAVRARVGLWPRGEGAEEDALLVEGEEVGVGAVEREEAEDEEGEDEADRRGRLLRDERRRAVADGREGVVEMSVAVGDGGEELAAIGGDRAEIGPRSGRDLAEI